MAGLYQRCLAALARGGGARVTRWLLVIGVGLGGAIGPLARGAQAADPPTDFSDWHYPVPAGTWLISRGPCGGSGLYTHGCEYFEDRCAFDLTPLDASMESVPVLAPQAGQVFFAGNRNDSGLSVMLRHADGRVSALFHLSQIVVAPEAYVAQGQVVGYAGSSGSSTGPHLHFDVQPNAVERSCLPLESIDEFDRRTMTIVSHNLAWPALTLPDPPADVPAWLPLHAELAEQPLVVFPGGLLLTPGAVAAVPVAVQTAAIPTGGLVFGGQRLTATGVEGEYSLFTLPLTAPSTLGGYSRALSLRRASGRETSFPADQPLRANGDGARRLVLLGPGHGEIRGADLHRNGTQHQLVARRLVDVLVEHPDLAAA